MINDRHLSAALETVSAACAVARSVQCDLDRVRRITKDDKSPVTVADFAVQAVVVMGLIEALGQAVIVGEENACALRSSEQKPVLDAVVEAVRGYRAHATVDQVLEAIDHCDHDASAASFWTLDPIDGTKGFLRGQQYAIALARIEDGRVTLGVMGCPNLPVSHEAPLDAADSSGSMYVATLGGGTWEISGTNPTLEARRIHATAFKPGDAVRACESVEAAHSKQDDTARVLAELGPAGRPARLDSQCKYSLVARGQADLYLRVPTSKSYVEKIWDHAAGMLIATEAGAMVSDISGAPLDFTRGRRLERNRGIVCAAAGLHARVIDVIDSLRIGAAV